ncbi:hypothetical protein HRW14_28275 [Streptomyces lunaelactis]|uniref:hypothetical protein n=1 Tax=Streptomyces lunaelactis TaxID=1535768 RepID=UPI001585A30A|nr:hypothetical protein [Streptomyces lunaelactis]NUK54099.1 hypothetical protein [Streptomyces lunaelactis]NUK66772.1 hypothetical protein [Streptomyces lunaelactis]
MTKEPNSSSRIRGMVARSIATAAITLGSVGALAPVAMAGGGPADGFGGCYVTWGSTGSAGHCTPAKSSGYWGNKTACNAQSDKFTETYIKKGGYVDPWGRLSCTWSVERASLLYRF